jgi:hypothetical protein
MAAKQGARKEGLMKAAGGSVGDAVLAAERAMAKAFINRDIKTMEEILDDDYIGVAMFADRQLARFNKGQMAGSLATLGVDEYEMENVTTREISKDAGS